MSNVATCAGLYDVFTDKMGAVKATAGTPSLKTFPVEARGGALWLLG